MKSTAVWLLAGMLVAGSALVAAPGARAQGAAAPASVEPTFKSEKYAAQFAEAKKRYAAGDYKKARSLFTTARRGADGKASRAALDRWLLAVKYSPGLVRMRSLIEKKHYQQAYAVYGQLYAKLATTPAAAQLGALYQQLDKVLFQTIESFDFPRRDYSEKYGKYFMNDKRYVFRGTRCLRWKNTADRKPGMLKVRTVPRDWRGYAAVEFWVYNTRTLPVEVVIVTDPGAGAKEAEGPRTPGAALGRIVSSYMYPTKLPGRAGWNRIHLPIKLFEPQGAATLALVKDFRIQISGGKLFDFLIDEIRLMRKDPRSASGSRR